MSFSKAKANQIAKKIARHLFTAHNGEHCAQLALIERIGDEKNLGGWGENALANVIYKEIVATPKPSTTNSNGRG